MTAQSGQERTSNREGAMSYDLAFWRYKAATAPDPEAVYRQLCDGLVVDVVDALPIDEMKQRVADEFAARGWERLDEDNWTSTSGSFQIFAHSQFFSVSCYGMEGEDMNVFIDVAHAFACALYDPQVGKRFEG